MSSSYDIIKMMRGETSDPLVQELARLIEEGREKNHNSLIVQVKSELVAKGLTLIFSLDIEPTAWIFLARKEVPEFDDLSWTTTLRRSSTIRAWLDWIFSISTE